MIRKSQLIFALFAIFAAVLTSISSMKDQRKRWPELEGVNVDLAVKTIRKENPRLNVIKVRSGSAVTMDYRLDRVRVMYDKRTNLVRGVPTIG